jgi:uncharacterized membrane protein YidH (DUF202 family)
MNREYMLNSKFQRLIKKRIITEESLHEYMEGSISLGKRPEEILLEKGIPKHEILFCLAEYCGCPFVEFDENIRASQDIIRQMDLERLKTALWFPLSSGRGKAEVIAYDPASPAVLQDIKATMGVEAVEFQVALSSDIIRIIENNQDINPNFPPSSGRTQLAKVRTFLAYRRSLLASYRTLLSKGRTGLAFLRTGLSLVTISLLLIRIFGLGYWTIIDFMLLATGIVMTIDGFAWYIPAREIGRKKLFKVCTAPTTGTSVLEVVNPEGQFFFTRTAPVLGADTLRTNWKGLTPVMRRRFLANDRTDFAEERTLLSFYRTLMAKARTGLALTRTGVAFIGLGIALLRLVRKGSWDIFSYGLVITGGMMVLEGLYWYLPGRRAGKESFRHVKAEGEKTTIWDMVFPPVHKRPADTGLVAAPPPVKASHSPGIWGTTGLALERTVLAERRNVMARLRTIMARSRTGLGFVRTGMNFSAVGAGLLVSFGTGNLVWTIAEIFILLTGLALIADGLYWHIPAEKIRKQFPYCFGEMEIVIPDYGKPARSWGKVVFSHDNE